VLLFWESGGEGQKLGADFGFKSQQLNFGEIREFLVKSEGNELPFRKEKTRERVVGPGWYGIIFEVWVPFFDPVT
jgi:hypothetical protein